MTPNAALVTLALFAVGHATTLRAQRAPSSAPDGELARTRLAAAEALLHLNRISTARGYLEAVPVAERELPWHFLDRALDRSARTRRLEERTPPTASVLSPDGRLLAVASADGAVRLLAYPSLDPVRLLRGHTGSVSTVAFSPDGTRLASGGRDHAVVLWDVGTGASLATNSASFSQGIYQVRFSPDGARIGVATWEMDRSRATPVVGFAKLLDARDLAEQRKIETDPHPAAGIVFHPDGRTLIVSSWGEIAYGFDIATGATRWRYDLSARDEYNSFHTIALSPDGSTLALGSTDARIHLLNAADGTLRRRIEPWVGHQKTLKALAFSRDGRSLASAGEDQTILVWDTDAWTRRATLVGHVATVNGLNWSADGAMLVSSAADSALKVWDLARPFVRRARVCEYGPWQAPIPPDRRYFVAACSDKRLVLHDLATGKELATLGPQSGLAAVVTADGRQVISASFDGVVRRWDVAGRREVRAYAGHTARIDGVALLERNGRIVSVGDTTLRVWDIESGRVVKVVRFDSAPFRVVAHSDEGRVFVSTESGSIRVLETEGWTEVARYAVPVSASEITLSADGTMLAVFAGRAIHVWDTGRGTRRYTLLGHDAGGYGVGFSPDGRWLVTGANDNTMRLWDLRTGVAALTYHDFDDAPYRTQFVGPREILVTSGEGRLWHFRF